MSSLEAAILRRSRMRVRFGLGRPGRSPRVARATPAIAAIVRTLTPAAGRRAAPPAASAPVTASALAPSAPQGGARTAAGIRYLVRYTGGARAGVDDELDGREKLGGQQ